MIKTSLVILISLFLFACNKEDATKEKPDAPRTQSQDENENDSDSTLSPEEAFSSALVQEIIGETDDIDLQLYLEEQIYPLVSKSGKVTIDRISSSVYQLSYDDRGTRKNIFIQKFYDPGKDEIIFERNDSQFNAVKQVPK